MEKKYIESLNLIMQDAGFMNNLFIYLLSTHHLIIFFFSRQGLIYYVDIVHIKIKLITKKEQSSEVLFQAAK